MKNRLAFVIIVLLFLSIVCFAQGETIGAQQIILMTEYRQIGWGESFSLGALTSDGKLWLINSDSWDEVPFKYDELLAWAESSDDWESIGSISASSLADVQSLIATVEAQQVIYSPVANDAGDQTSFARRTSHSGQPEIIVLGASGDDLYENTDPAAQSLYRFLRKHFPQVISYDGDTIAPAGFQPVDICEFCGYKSTDPSALTITARYNDCEAGSLDIDPDKTIEELTALKVTGKRNSLYVTGDTTTYILTDADGKNAAVFEFYGDLLIAEDGMYTVSK